MKTHIKIVIIILVILLWLALLTAHLVISNSKKPGGIIDIIISVAMMALIGSIWRYKKENKDNL